jgi:ribosomal protein S18 acetylase RimI-like enzyme
MNDYELKPTQENDIGMMSRIHTESFDDAWTGPMIRRILSMPGSGGLVARAGRPWSIAGFTILRTAADECEILSLAVALEHRGRGVGALLLDGAIVQAHALGATKLFLEVAEDNEIARRLYDSRGLVAVGRRPGYYTKKDGTTAAAVTMSRALEEVVGVSA